MSELAHSRVEDAHFLTKQLKEQVMGTVRYTGEKDKLKKHLLKSGVVEKKDLTPELLNFAHDVYVQAQIDTELVVASHLRGAGDIKLSPYFAGCNTSGYIEKQHKVKDLVAEYIAQKRTEKLRSTSVDGIEKTLNEFMTEHKNSNWFITQIETKHVDKFLQYWIKKDLAKSTIEGHFSRLRTFLRWCYNKEYINKIPGERLTIPNKAGGVDIREAFDAQDLETIFHSPQYLGHKPDGIVQRDGSRQTFRDRKGNNISMNYQYWFHPLALSTGMRLAEICQLRFEHIKLEHGIHYIDLSKFDAEGKEVTRIKTKAGTRCIPIHPELIKLGFLEFVKHRKKQGNGERIFHEVSIGKDGKWTVAGKKPNAYLKQVGVHRRYIKVFHSYRHTFKRALRSNGVEEEYRIAIMGHEPEDKKKGSHRTYDQYIPLEELQKCMDSIKFPVDLSPLTPFAGEELIILPPTKK